MKRAICGLSLCLLLSQPAFAEGRQSGWPHAWCGAWLAQHFGIGGQKARELWLARNWLRFPKTSAHVGAVAVMRHHVGIVTDVDPNGNPVILSGNHNNRVGTGVYPRNRILAYVSVR